jgi:4-amino-4-deoxy-L-arabinose transferase-like glycosyltransferase
VHTNIRVHARSRGRHVGAGKTGRSRPAAFIGAGAVVLPNPSPLHRAVSKPRERAAWIVPVGTLALFAIVCLQAAMSLRLRNTAFEDEALYLYAGRMELAHLLYGVPLQSAYASYFSGAPVLYPVVAAALNAVGGLALARALSLAEMLAVTAMVYSIARSLFNERVALCSAAVFAVSEPTIFLGHLATFDATCLFLLATATWIIVRWSGSRRPVYLLAAPIVALAVAVKYAGVLFVPTIAVLPVLASWPALGRRALPRLPAFIAVVAALLFCGLRLAGPAYDQAIGATLTGRPAGTVSSLAIGRESLAWGAVIMVLAVVGAVICTLGPRTESGESVVAGGRWRRAALGAALAGTAFLAPAYQMYLHTDLSLLKHIGFGLFFASPMAGLGLVRLVGDHLWRRQAGIALWCTALVLGMSGSWSLYSSWPSSGPLVKAVSAYLRPDARYLVEAPEVPIYYLQGLADAQPDQFWSTSAITYVDSKGQRLTGDAGFTAAIRAGFFRLVAYSDYATPATDAVIAGALKSSPAYQLAAVVQLADSNGPVDYYIWVAGLTSRAQLDSVGPVMLRSWTRPRIQDGPRGSPTCTPSRWGCPTSRAFRVRQAIPFTRWAASPSFSSAPGGRTPPTR